MFGLGIFEIVLLVIVIAVVANLSGKRPGMTVSVAAFGFLALVLLASVVYFFRAMPGPPEPPRAVMWSDSAGAMSASWPEGASHPVPPSVAQAKWRIAIFPILLLGGAAVATFALLRRAGGACAVGHARGWWPAALLLLLIPLPFLFLMGLSRVDRVASVSNYNVAEMRARDIHERVTRQQAELERRQAEIAHRTSELNSELEHRIEKMEIHKLMDLVDAPRIMLPIPTPATIAQWAQVAGAVEKSTNEKATVQAEADAAVKLIGAEVEAAPADSTEPFDGEAPSAAGSSASAEVASDGAEESVAEQRSDSPQESPWAARRSVSPPESSSTGSSATQPSWVGSTPKRVGNVRRDVVATDEYATSDECYWAADRLLQLKTYEHIQRLLGRNDDANRAHQLRSEALNVEGHYLWFPRELEKAGITVDFIRREIARDEYLEKVERSFGPMLKLYTLIEFSPSIDNELRQRWDASQRQERFAFVGFGATSVLGLLGLAWGLLKVDTLTKGYYTKRLFIGVPLAIVGSFGLYALLLEMGFDLPH